MGIESRSLERDKPGTHAFNKEMEKAIQSLMKRGYDPTPDNIFSFFRTHPADFPHVMRLILLGMESHLRIYLACWAKIRGSVEKRVTRQEAEEMLGDGLGLTKKEDESSGPLEVDIA